MIRMSYDDGKFNDWVNSSYDTLVVGFAEANEDLFDEYCFKRFIEPREPQED
jgi:hypothetical protein